MNITALQTPAIVLDLDRTERNIRRYHDAARAHGKEVWPMVKTHKSLELARLQAEYGCTGFLCGTLDEAEALCEAGFDNLMYAYPVATDVSARRVAALAKKCRFFVRLDGPDAACILDRAAAEAGVTVDYTIIVDSGLHRFGVKPENVCAFAEQMRRFSHLTLRGISTHPGQVYGAACRADVERCCREERRAMAAAAEALRRGGFAVELVTSGSTPTFFGALDDENINVCHPGNYVYHDVIQLSMEAAAEEDCALSVLAAVIAHPSEDLFLCDAGSKCLGLDQGAHGGGSIRGFGRVVGHPELTVCGLSEEVGKLRADGPTTLRVGEIIRIIPNHSCSAANLTRYCVGIRGDEVERLVEVDLRSNATCKGFPLTER